MSLADPPGRSHSTPRLKASFRRPDAPEWPVAGPEPKRPEETTPLKGRSSNLPVVRLVALPDGDWQAGCVFLGEVSEEEVAEFKVVEKFDEKTFAKPE